MVNAFLSTIQFERSARRGRKSLDLDVSACRDMSLWTKIYLRTSPSQVLDRNAVSDIEKDRIVQSMPQSDASGEDVEQVRE